MQFIRNNDRTDGKPIIYNSASEAGLVKTNFDITKYVKRGSIPFSGYTGNYLTLSPDGRSIFVLNSTTYFNCYKYQMLPFKISTVGYNTNADFMTSAGLYISPDGLNFFGIYHYPLEVRHWVSSVPWVFPTNTTPVNVIDISYITSSNMAYYGMWPSITFKPDGTQMYACVADDNWTYKVHQFSLGTAWDVSTATSPATKIMPLGDSDKNIAFSPDGTKCFFGRGSSGVIYSEPLGTAWDISTNLGSEPSLTVLVPDMYSGPAPFAFAFNEAGNRLFVYNGTNLDEWHFVG